MAFGAHSICRLQGIRRSETFFRVQYPHTIKECCATESRRAVPVSQIERIICMKCVISVLGKDRSGIVAAVATCLANHGANIDDINQTLLDDIFCMNMMVTLNPEVGDFNTVQEALTAVGEDLGMQIIIQREDVFQFMYKI